MPPIVTATQESLCDALGQGNSGGHIRCRGPLRDTVQSKLVPVSVNSTRNDAQWIPLST